MEHSCPELPSAHASVAVLVNHVLGSQSKNAGDGSEHFNHQKGIKPAATIMQVSRETGPAASVIPVRVPGGKGIALESSFQHGLKQERLRTLCQVVNSTSLTLEVSIVEKPQASQPSPAITPQASRTSLRTRQVSLSAWHRPALVEMSLVIISLPTDNMCLKRASQQQSFFAVGHRHDRLTI